MKDPQQSANTPADEQQPADYGNASNPSPHYETAPAGNQLLGEQAEK